MSVGAVVYNAANTGAAIASTNITVDGIERGLLDAVTSDPLNRDAEIQIEVHRSHPSASAFTPGRTVRIVTSDGEDTKFEILSTDDHKVSDAPSETLRVSGRTLLSQWREWLLVPHGTSDRVAYDFSFPGLDESSFTSSVANVDRSALGFTRPIGWADPFTGGVWSGSAQQVFGRTRFTAAAGKYVGYASGDSGFAIHLDGERHSEKWPKDSDTEPIYWRPYRAIAVDLAAGEHTLAVEGRKGSSGLGTVWVSLWPVTGNRLGDAGPVRLTGPSSNTAEPIGVWKWSTSATRPAPPATTIVTDQFAKIQAKGGAAGWTLGFTASLDSDGVTPARVEWGESTSKSGYDMFESLSTAGWLNFEVRPGAGKILDARVTVGVDTGLTHVDDDLGDLRRQVQL